MKVGEKATLDITRSVLAILYDGYIFHADSFFAAVTTPMETGKSPSIFALPSANLICKYPGETCQGRITIPKADYMKLISMDSGFPGHIPPRADLLLYVSFAIWARPCSLDRTCH